MKHILACLLVAGAMTACTRSGTTIASDDSAIEKQVNTATGENSRTFNYPLDPKQIPVAIITNFWSRCPAARYVTWTLLRDGNYQAVFGLGKIWWTVVYAPDGTLLSEEQG